MASVILTNMCMLRRADGRILALNKVSPAYPGVTFPGGHIEPGESLTEAIRREVREETGLTLGRVAFRGVYDWLLPDGGRYLVFLYESRDFSGTLRASDEGSLSWVTEAKFLSLPLAQGMGTVLRMMKDPAIGECFYDPASGRETLF